MEAEIYLKMSVINALLTIKKYKNLYPNKDFYEIVALIKGIGSYLSTYDYDLAVTLMEEENLDGVEDIRDYIKEIIKRKKPNWLYQFPYGRELVSSSLKDNEYFDIIQCFNSAGLFDNNPDQQVVEWWDNLASEVRSHQNEEKLRAGRIGELLSLQYEMDRLRDYGLEPKWISVDNNFAGYDVLSYEIDCGNKRQIMIEVKACTSYPLSFYLSKNEWELANVLGNNYRLHLWNVPKKQLLIYHINDIEPNIPINNGNGIWQNVLITV